MVVEDFGARAARPGVPHAPEIVGGGDADDAVIAQPGDAFPQRRRLVVLGIDGDQQLLLRQGEVPRQQGPGMLDRQRLEVIAEREIAQHLEEGVVAGGVADIVQVVVLAARPHAFLGGGRARVWPLFCPGEHVLELDHAAVGEQQRRVVARHQRRRRHGGMAVAGEEIEEGGADVVAAGHDRRRYRSRNGWARGWRACERCRTEGLVAWYRA